MRFLHVVHDRLTRPGPGLVGDAMLEQGHEVVVWDFELEQEPPEGLLDFAGVVLYGGRQDVGQYERHPWLAAEEEMIAQLLAAQIPLLGICLGAQLLAQALGGEILALAEPELGWREVRLEAAAAADPLFRRLPSSFQAAEWHSYDFACPPQATLLARSSACAQAFRKGRAWGVQFHPEVTGAILAQWSKTGWTGFMGGDPAAADSALERRRLADWNAVGHQLAEAFVAQAELMVETRAPRSMDVL